MGVFLSAAIWFFALTMLFAVALFCLGRSHPSCIDGPTDDDSAAYGAKFLTFVDAYSLSWTTFSTVGYGVISAATSATTPDVRRCTGITIVVSLESFVGNLFACMCGAIIFAKVGRVQSYAQVFFSDAIVIRYGAGIAVECDHDADELVAADESKRLPCPVLEFRINNRLHSIAGGEIMDASVNVVASIDACQAFPEKKEVATRRRRGGKKGKKGSRRTVTGRSTPALPEKRETTDSSSHHMSVESLRTANQVIYEDPSGLLEPRHIFAKLEIETTDHPFFKRVWFVRHRLDVESPLLRNLARTMIKRNGGFWPSELNSYQGVRAAVHFDKILVSMSGTSNADANSVYSQKVYELEDVLVGYRFVNQLYRDAVDGSLVVDTTLINDVMEQAGGGGESLMVESHQGGKISDMVVL
jgi:hypothetical protein